MAGGKQCLKIKLRKRKRTIDATATSHAQPDEHEGLEGNLFFLLHLLTCRMLQIPTPTKRKRNTTTQANALWSLYQSDEIGSLEGYLDDQPNDSDPNPSNETMPKNKKRGPTKLKGLGIDYQSERVEVEFNERGQPIGDASVSLDTFCRALVRLSFNLYTEMERRPHGIQRALVDHF